MSLAVNGWKDHIHAFFGLPVTISTSDFVGLIKSNSSKWINDTRKVAGKFEWQPGYGAFSYSRSQRDTIIKYIINQEIHHRSNTFKEEYIQLLSGFEVEYNEKYLFEFYD